MAVVEDEGLLQVTLEVAVRQSPTRISDADDEWVTVIVPLKSASAAQLVPILRPLMPQAGHLAASVDRNALLLVDRAANARRLIGIARALDRLPPKPIEMSRP